MKIRASLIALIIVTLPSCDDTPTNSAAGVSQSEADALNNAAEMLDEPPAAPQR